MDNKEPLTREDFVEIFEFAWASTCQSDSSYIREVGVKQALLDEWSSLMDGLEEDYSFERFTITSKEFNSYKQWAN